MALLTNERMYAQKMRKLYGDLDRLYNLIEWGGLSEKKWKQLHELEDILKIPGEPATCFCDTIKVADIQLFAAQLEKE